MWDHDRVFLLPMSSCMAEIFRSQICVPYLPVSFFCTAGSSGDWFSTFSGGDREMPSSQGNVLQCTPHYYIFCNIFSKLRDKIISQRIYLWCKDGGLKPWGWPGKARMHAHNHGIFCCKSWWHLCCLNSVWVARERQKWPQPPISCSLPSKLLICMLVHASGRCKFHLTLQDNLDAEKMVKCEGGREQKKLKNLCRSFSQATSWMPPLAAWWQEAGLTHFQSLSAPALPGKDCIWFSIRICGPLCFLHRGIQSRMQWIPLHLLVLREVWKRRCELVYLVQLSVYFCMQVNSWTLGFLSQQSKLPPLVRVLSSGMQHMALCECREPFYVSWLAKIDLFFLFMSCWHCKVPAQLTGATKRLLLADTNCHSCLRKENEGGK